MQVVNTLNRFKVFIQVLIKGRYFNYVWLLSLCILCYGLLIPLLGFYWDDLPYLYQLSVFGPGGFPDYVASDRPFSAWIFMISTTLFKFNLLGYHLLALLLRFFSVILFYKILKIIWGKKPELAFYAASIFAVYPGFLQQPIALIYIHHFSVLTIFLSSLLFMINAVKGEKLAVIPYVISILGSFQIFSIENFATLELIRSLIIWHFLRKKAFTRKALAQQTILLWAPYLIIFTGFLIWRVAIFSFPTYDPGLLNDFKQNFFATFIGLLNRIPDDFYKVTIGSWIKSFWIPNVSSFGKQATILFWILISISFLFTYLVNAIRLDSQKDKNIFNKIIFGVVFVSVILFVLAGSIVWVLDLPIEIQFAWDRMTLAFIPSVALFFGAILFTLNKHKWVQSLVFALLISSAIGSHFENSMRFKRDWENIRQMQWQLSWRIPDLAKDSTLITSEPGLSYYSDNSLTGPLNLMYSNQKSSELDYLLYFSDVRLGLGLKALKKDIPITQKYRSFSFSGNTSQIIAYKFSPPSCLTIMDRVYSNSITNLNLTDLQTKELKLTNLSLINATGNKNPPQFLFGVEPEPSWCYYFEKADLARQYKDYAQIVSFGDQVFAKNLFPRTASEWLPFLEGYTWVGQWDKVDLIINEITLSEKNFNSGLCYTLRRINSNLDFPYHEKMQDLLKGYNCQ